MLWICDQVFRKCGRAGEVKAECVNGGAFCTCKGDLCNSAPPAASLMLLLFITLLGAIMCR